MKKIGMMVILLNLTIMVSANDLFEYNSTVMDIGNLYSYSISDFDSENRTYFYQYITPDNKIHILSDFSNIMPQIFYRVATFDQQNFVFSEIYSENPFAYMKLATTAISGHSEWDFENNEVVTTSQYFDSNSRQKTQNKVYEVGENSCYSVSLFHIDFAIAMRHFIGTNEDAFEVGNLFQGFNIDSNITFEGVEEVDGILCDRWVMEGEGFLAKIKKAKAVFWFAKDDPFYTLIQYRCHMKIAPYENIQVNLLETTTVSIEEWETFVESVTDDAKSVLGFVNNN